MFACSEVFVFGVGIFGQPQYSALFDNNGRPAGANGTVRRRGVRFRTVSVTYSGVTLCDGNARSSEVLLDKLA